MITLEEKRKQWQGIKQFNKTDAYFDMTIARLQFFKPYLEGKYVLDAGCGPGLISRWITEEIANSAVGYDIDHNQIKFGKIRYCEPILELRLSASGYEMASIINNGLFNVVVNLDMIEHLEGPETHAFIEWCHSALEDGGYFLCATPNKLIYSNGSDKSPNPEHLHEFTPDELRDTLQAYFSEVEIYGQHKGDYPKVKEAIERYCQTFPGANPDDLHFMYNPILPGNLDKAYSLIAVCRK